jgi:hypothetical protein
MSVGSEMSLRFLVLVFISFAGCAAPADQDAYVRGALIWRDDKQAITECKTGRVYWVRVLASNPHFLLSQRIKELTSEGAESIIAELRGEMSAGAPSLGPGYAVDGTLKMNQVISVERGSCEK